jgi:hypothetical protein
VRKFIANVLVMILLLLGISLVLQLGITYKIRNKTINGQDNFHVIKGQNNDLVFLGSSRCSEHFDPKFFKDSLGLKSVNLGVNGHGDLTMQTIRLKYYLRNNVPPRVAVLNFDPISTYGPYNIEDNNNFIEKNYYARYAFYPVNEDTMLVKYFHFTWPEKYIPMYALLRYRAILDCITMRGGKDWLNNGFQKHTTTWDTVRYPVITKEFFKNYLPFVKDKDSIKSHLAVFNNYCKANNIKLVCVQSPVYKAIYDSVSFSVLKPICNSLGILFIDTNEPYINRDINNFADADHLNTTGIPKMLNIIAKNREFLELVGMK